MYKSDASESNCIDYCAGLMGLVLWVLWVKRKDKGVGLGGVVNEEWRGVVVKSMSSSCSRVGRLQNDKI